jgi:hypothetical protein
MGLKTCNDLTRAAGNRSTEEFLGGTAMAVAGATGVVVGMLMGPDTAPDAAWHERNRYLFVITPSAVVAAVGIATMARSQKTDTLADETRTIVVEGKGEADRHLYYECLSARADWSGNHRELTRLQIELLKENHAAASAAQSAASNADAQASVATSLANEAKTTAAKASQVASASAEATKDLAAVTEKVMEAAPKKASEKQR